MKLIKARELANILGVTISTVYNLDNAGQLPQSVKFGKSRRWDFDEIVNFFKDKKEAKIWVL